MADMEKEKIEESKDDSVFSMYSDWIDNGYVDTGEVGYEQEIKSEVTNGIETIGSLSTKCEKLKQQIDSEKDRLGTEGDASEHIQENIDKLENELAETERRLQILNEAQEAEFLASQEKITEKQAKPGNPFEALLKIIEKNAPEEAAALKEVQQYMEEMDNHYKSMRNELENLKKQLAERSDSSDLGRQVVKNLEKNVDGLKAHHEGFLKKLFQKAVEVIRNFKARGVIALNGIVQKLGIKESLQEGQKYYLDNATKMQKSIDKFDAINSEIYAAKSHIKNIGRMAVGKEAQQPPQDKENIIIKILKRPYVQNRDMYRQMAEKTERKIERLENLEQKAAQARSTVAKLSDYKKKAAPRDESQKEGQNRENIRKKPEMAL